MKARVSIALFIALVAVASTGCWPAIQAPLSDEANSTPDLKLIGTWQPSSRWDPMHPDDSLSNDERRDRLTFRRAKDRANVMQVLAYDHDRDRTETFDLLLTTIGKNKYASIALRDPKAGLERKPIYLFCKYEVKDVKDESYFAYWIMDIPYLRDAIEKKELGHDGTSANIATTDLRKFIEKHDDKFFSQAFTSWKRVESTAK